MAEPTSINKHRRYTKREKAVAVVAAVASSTLAAAEQSGIPESTLRYWVDSPEFAEVRDKARAEIAPVATTVAFYAWVETLRMLREHKFEPHDVIFLTGLATDKAQLLNGGPTSRIETRSLTESLDDHERQALRDVIDRAIAESAAASAGGDPVGAGAEVRE